MRSPRPPRRRIRALVPGLAALVAAVALASPALAAPTPPPLPSGPGTTSRSTPVAPRAGQAAKARLDARRATAPANVTAWWVDPGTHQTVVAVVGPTTRSAGAFAADDDPSAVRVQPMSAPIRPLDAPAPPGPLIGGTTITTSGTRCSDGFSARRGTTTYLLTAGHCTAEGRTWNGPDRRPVGTAVRTDYPGHDFGIVQVTNTAVWQGSGRIQGGPTITGTTPASTGTQVCRSGSTSGYHCGVVQATDVTVNYGSGTVITGLTQTTVCADPGDSGGPYLTPDSAQAQGTLSGGTGDCVAGGTTYFQPIAPVLDSMGLTLVTGP
ncbi:S1 family peptidase [Actinomycetospora endophytica]|uniref:S1 family peptidase n=1 Tax=Actinomycetospora endophytica TaxID=2291215 RepID=A0ABS8PF67_9PSEU|nr:S1 family peptidase [Actinomycetospora endophytica]MCD2195654.1 S1 family peptidase [Actinomycetospora endophytica]